MKKVAMRFASVTYSKFGNEAIAKAVKEEEDDQVNDLQSQLPFDTERLVQ